MKMTQSTVRVGGGEKKKGRNQPTTQVPLSSAKSSSPQKIGVSNDLGKISLNGEYHKSVIILTLSFGMDSTYPDKRTILTEILVQLPTSCRG